MSDRPESCLPLVEVGRYARLAEARPRGLVIAALDLPHWIEREGDEWVLRVEAPAREVATRELAAFEQEERERPPAPEPLLEEKVSKTSLLLAAWVLGAFFFAQNLLGEWWLRLGAAESAALLGRGEWWRLITALTLHGDAAHLAANLGTGLLFAAFVFRPLGAGVTWLAVLLSGAAGNWINAWGYRGEAHVSIGASTAVFGALGLLVGAEFVARLRARRSWNRFQLLVPLGVGLAFLAFLGVGEEGRNVDIMAHLWGLAAGTPLGAVLAILRVRERLPRMLQWLSGILALLLPVAAWAWALQR